MILSIFFKIIFIPKKYLVSIDEGLINASHSKGLQKN